MSGIGPGYVRHNNTYCEFFYILMFSDLYDPHNHGWIGPCFKNGLWATGPDGRVEIDEHILAGIEHFAKEEQIEVICECCLRPFQYSDPYRTYLAIKVCYKGVVDNYKRLSVALGVKLAKWIIICDQKGFLSGYAALD